MDVSLLNNLIPLPAADLANGAVPQGSEGGDEGAFQLLLENMLFKAVAGQVFKEGGGLLAGMDLGLVTEEGRENKENQGQDLLALLEMLQGPLLDHFREAQLQLNPVNEEPVLRVNPGQGEGPAVTSLPVMPETEERLLMLGLQQANEQFQAGKGDNPVQATVAEGQFLKETDLGARPWLDSEDHKNTMPKQQFKFEAEQAKGSTFSTGAGPNEEQLQPEMQAGRENSFMNQAGEQIHKPLETIQQARSVQPQQVPRAGGGFGFSELADQLIQSGKLKILGDKQEMQIQLKPEYLGKLAIRLTLENGVMTARFLIENQHVARMVDSNLYQLKQTLEEQGIQFDQVQVEVGDPGSFFQKRHQEWQGQRDNPPVPFTVGKEETGEETENYQALGSQGGIDYRA